MNERRKRKNVNASEYERARENSYLTEYMYRKKKDISYERECARACVFFLGFCLELNGIIIKIRHVS